jgi:60 kDa SS-A/Ro ribonucleoprotein
MARLNTKEVVALQSLDMENQTFNEEGVVAWKLPAKSRLIERVLGAFWSEDTFYKEGSKIAAEIVKDIKEVAAINPKFVLQLAAYARNEIYLRTTPQVLLVEAANIEACKPFIREYAPKIIKRADELSEVIAYQLSAHGKPIPNSLKKGLAAAFATFDDYQLNKYDSAKKAVSLGDVLNLIYRKEGYPVSKAMRNYLVNDVVDVEGLPKIAALKQLLALPEFNQEAMDLIAKSGATWENVISKFGSTKETWEAISPKMGYMALLRNLRNFEKVNLDLDPILVRITDEKAVKFSKQLPYRFYSAYKEIENQKILRAIAKAFELSISNVTLGGSTAVLVDLSGSMTGATVSAKSKVTNAEVAAVLGAIVTKKAKESVVIGFGEDARIIRVNPDDTMITNIEKIVKTNVGHSTNAGKAFGLLNAGDIKVDRIVLVSDMQCYNTTDTSRYSGITWGGYASSYVNEEWKKYLAQVNKNAYLYSLDIGSYGTRQTPTKSKNVILINGWSDKIIDYMNIVENNVMEQQIARW